MADELKRVGLVFKADGTIDFQRSLKEVNAAVQENRSSFKLAKSQWDESTKAADKLKDRQEYLAKQTKDYSDKVLLLTEQLKEMEEGEKRDEAAIAKKRTELNNTKATLSAYEKGLEEVNDKLKSGTLQMEEYAKKIEAAGTKAVDTGKKLSTRVSAPIAAIGGVAIKSATDFEDAMAKVSTIADTTEVPIEKLQEAIIELSNQTGIEAKQIAGNVYDAISAGQSTGDAVNFVTNATKLAKAGFTDTDSALDILTTTMNSYGLEAEKVTEISDILITTQNLGKVTVDELSASMGKVIPTAKANKVGVEQVATAYAIMTSKGIAAAETTTYVNSMFNELGKAGTKVSDTLKNKTGKSFSELMDEGKTVSEVLEIINQSAKKQNLAFTDMWGSAEAGKAALVLLGDDSKNFNQVLEKMKNSTNATDMAFNKLDTTSNSARKSMNQLKNVGIDLGTQILEVLAPIIDAITKKVQDFSNWFGKLDDEQKQTIVTIGLIVAAVGPLLIIFGTLAGSTTKIITLTSTVIKVAGKVPGILSTVGTGAKFLWTILSANPIGAVITIVGGLVAAFVTLYNKCDWFREGVDKIFKKVKKILKDVVDWIKDIFDFEWKLPDIKLPHFKIKGSFSLSPPSVPSLSIDWYAKGGILKSPTIFGRNGDSFMGGGEAGPEAVLPIALLKTYIREEMQGNNENLVKVFVEALKEVKLVAENNIYIGDRKVVEILTEMVMKRVSEKMITSMGMKGKQYV